MAGKTYMDMLTNLVGEKAVKSMQKQASTITSMYDKQIQAQKEQVRVKKQIDDYAQKILRTEQQIARLEKVRDRNTGRWGNKYYKAEAERRLPYLKGNLSRMKNMSFIDETSSRYRMARFDARNRVNGPLAAPVPKKGAGGAAGGMGRGGGGGGGVGDFVEMLGNFMGGEFYYFAKGIGQASKTLAAWGVAIYATMKLFGLLNRAIREAIRVFKDMVRYADEQNRLARQTRIASGSFGRATEDLKWLRSARSKGSIFITDEEYKITRQRLQQLGEGFTQNLAKLRDLATYTGSSIADVTQQWYDAVMFGGTQLYATLGMNERQVQKMMSIFPEGTTMAREALRRFLDTQKQVNGAFARTPRTVDEMMQRLRGFKEEFFAELMGDPQDPTSVYAMYRDTIKGIADFLVDNKRSIMQTAALIGSYVKHIIRIAQSFGRVVGRQLQRWFQAIGATADEFPKRLAALELYLSLQRARMRKWWKDNKEYIREFAQGVWDGLWPIRAVIKGIIKAVELLGKSFEIPVVGKWLKALSIFIVKLGVFGASLRAISSVIKGFAGAFGRVFTVIGNLVKSKSIAKFGKDLTKAFKPFDGAVWVFKRFDNAAQWLLERMGMFGVKLYMGLTKGSKFFGKGLLKKIPVIGLLFALYDAAKRVKNRDWWGAIISGVEGVLSLFPGVGTALSFVAGGINVGRDIAAERTKKLWNKNNNPRAQAVVDDPDAYGRRRASMFWEDGYGRKGDQTHPNISITQNIHGDPSEDTILTMKNAIYDTLQSVNGGNAPATTEFNQVYLGSSRH